MPRYYPVAVVSLLLVISALSYYPEARTMAAESSLDVVSVIPTEKPNSHYQGNRAPLMPSTLIKLPIGNITPGGWLRGQLQLMADGMTGHMTELSQWCNFEESAWTSKDGKGKWPWEEMPYWLKGFGDLGYVLKNERVTSEATRWIKAIMASRREDGTFGPADNFVHNDLWPHMCTLYALRSYYEATGDPQVIKVMTGYFRYVSKMPPEKLFTYSKEYGNGWWQWIRAADQLDSIHWLYNQTGEKWLLDLAEVNHNRTADWTGGVASWHGVNIAECWRGPAQFFVQSRDPKHLQGSLLDYDTVRRLYGQVPGGMYGADENCREGFIGPRQGTETCSMVEMMYSHEVLLKVTGSVLWADRCEEVAFNMMPPTMTADLKALHYLTCPNQVQIDRENKSPMIQNAGDMFTYTPYEQFRCCQHNVAMGWPYYTEHLWFATPGNGLAAAMYAPSSVTAKVADGTEVSIEEQTSYPFDENVDLSVKTSKEVRFPLSLRIPGWCDKARLTINEEAQDVVAKAGSWVLVNRIWKDGDKLRLQLPMKVRMQVWEKNGNSVSVDRGPLTYSLKIGEKWQKYDTGRKWPGFEAFPVTPWNYGLVPPAGDLDQAFRFSRKPGPVADQPFTPEAAPVQLVAKARKIPEWTAEHNGLVIEVQQSPAKSNEPVEDITLIPMGCARLRIAAFPTVTDAPDGHVWKKLPPKPSVFASWCNPADKVLAAFDGIAPSSSGDGSIPRFTCWPHLGTNEWIEIGLPEAKTIRAVEVYWFDDTGAGQCRVPAKWSLTVRREGKWQPVTTQAPFGTDKDKFNRVEFEPVQTDRVRISVQLQPNVSAGILECRLVE